MVMFVLIAWVREIIIKPVAAALLRACRHIADGKAYGHPISEDIVRRSIWIRGQESKFCCFVDHYGRCESTRDLAANASWVV
jgi:hypothetical protein